MSIICWFLRQFRLNSFDTDSGKGLVATEKFKKLQVSGFSMEIQKVSGKKKKEVQVIVPGGFIHSPQLFQLQANFREGLTLAEQLLI